MLRLTFVQKTTGQPEGGSRETSPQTRTCSGDDVLEIIICDSKVIEVRPREPVRLPAAALLEPN